MTNLVAELREVAQDPAKRDLSGLLEDRAADEIERLRALLEETHTIFDVEHHREIGPKVRAAIGIADEPSDAPPGVMEALKLQASAAAAVDAQAVASSGLFRCVVCGTAMFIGPKQWLCPKCTPQRTGEQR